LAFSIDLLRRLYNTLALPCECVMTSYIEYMTYYTNTWVDYMQFYIVNLIGGDLDRGLGGTKSAR